VQPKTGLHPDARVQVGRLPGDPALCVLLKGSLRCPGVHVLTTGHVGSRLGQPLFRPALLAVWEGLALLGAVARAATPDEVKQLQLPPGEPVVELHRTTYTAAGTVVEFAVGVHAASRFAWEYDFKVPDSAKDRKGQQ
jgi:hypothetical protein